METKKTTLDPSVLDAIHGKKPQSSEEKREEYEKSLKRWWSEYAERKNHEEDETEHVASSLLYDRNHLPRTTPAPQWTNPPPSNQN